jgi:hypothetical protein
MGEGEGGGNLGDFFTPSQALGVIALRFTSEDYLTR